MSNKTTFARRLRQADNDAQRILWHHLRNRRLNGYKFVRELPIGQYFADFACRANKLVVETDGNWHHDCVQDLERDAYLNQQEWSVLRFQAGDIIAQIENVLVTIVEALEHRLDAMERPDIKFRPAPSTKQGLANG